MLKTATLKIQSFTPSKEVGQEKPTVIYFRQLTKREHDEIQDSMTEIKRGKVTTKFSNSFEKLLDKTLAHNGNGAYVENAVIDEKEYSTITDKETAKQFILGLSDIESANEIELKLRGISLLEDKEIKN